MATSNSQLPLLDRTHSLATTALTVSSALVTAVYAAWITAGFIPRPVSLVLVTALVGFGVYRGVEPRDVVARVFYSLAIVVALTPVALNVPVLLTADMSGVTLPLARILTVADLKLVLAFLAIAAVLSGIGFYVTNAAAVRQRLKRVIPV